MNGYYYNGQWISTCEDNDMYDKVVDEQMKKKKLKGPSKIGKYEMDKYLIVDSDSLPIIFKGLSVLIKDEEKRMKEVSPEHNFMAHFFGTTAYLKDVSDYLDGCVTKNSKANDDTTVVDEYMSRFALSVSNMERKCEEAYKDMKSKREYARENMMKMMTIISDWLSETADEMIAVNKIMKADGGSLDNLTDEQIDNLVNTANISVDEMESPKKY